MKATAIIAAIAMSVALLPSCANMASFNSTSATSVGTVAQLIPGTVVSARSVTIEATASDKNVGTGLGAAIGAGSGSLLGRGKGQTVSTVGGGVVGAVVGRTLASQAAKTAGQELVIQADGTQTQYRVTQPVYEQFGAITVGTHGNLEYGSTSKFVPDGH